ncbi:uncharacterized protein LOC123510712 [Portunus trituberculatus]|uniref:uncharacterized protein LOC123510712 n=1 Tax=Portunus trituberculatus TaxID=210409 RepID=UPI001E1D1FAC|nr:uncharacterized protein LOC123510712 [Portunus trituberculatus]
MWRGTATRRLRQRQPAAGTKQVTTVWLTACWTREAAVTSSSKHAYTTSSPQICGRPPSRVSEVTGVDNRVQINYMAAKRSCDGWRWYVYMQASPSSTTAEPGRIVEVKSHLFAGNIVKWERL